MGKRKRVQAMGSGSLAIASSQRDAAGAATPFARSPSERIQLSLAGLSDTDRDTTRGVRHFPHGALAAEHDRGQRDDDGDEDQPSKKKPAGAAAVGNGEKYFDVLLRSLHQMLGRGNLVRAERTYRLLFQLRPGGRPLDVRQHNIWALGAEILMRAGEKPAISPESDGNPATEAGGERQGHCRRAPIARDGFIIPARWGSSANIDKVKAYFEALIQRYPYDPKSPSKISALDFQLAMLGCEIYNVHLEYTAGLAKAGKEAGTRHGQHPAEKLDEAASGETSNHRGDVWQKDAGRQAKAEARERALSAMEDIARRMHSLLQALPYRKNNHFLRLRTTASLYTADLLTTTSQMTSSQRSETENRRRLQQRAAVDAIQMLVQNGGELDVTFQSILDDWAEKEDSPAPSSLQTSLPIRKI